MKVIAMNELILNTNSLPEPLSQMITTSRVKVHQADGVINLLPIDESTDSINKLFGMFSDGKMSIDKYLEEKATEKALEL
jgi:hypothetical protein